MNVERLSKYLDLGENFWTHLKLLLEISDYELPKIVNVSYSYLIASDEQSESKALEELKDVTSLDEAKKVKALRICIYLLRSINEEDTSEEFIQNLLVAGNLAEQLKPQLANLFSLLVEKKDSVDRWKQTRAATSKVVPTLESVDACVELRAVNRFEKGENKLQDYTPNIFGMVPLALVRLRIQDEESVVIQLDSTSLNRLIDAMGELRQDLDALVEDYKKLEILKR